MSWAVRAFPVYQGLFADRGATPGARDKFIDQVVRRGWIAIRDFIQNPIEREFGVGVTGFASEQKGSGLRSCPWSDNKNPVT